MANYSVRYVFQITDVNGDSALATVEDVFTGDTLTLAAGATNAGNIATALAACTNGKITQQSLGVLFQRAQISAGTAPPPASSTYPSVTDGARITFANSMGNRRAITIPAPLLTDFKTDSNVVNPDDANMAALIAVLEGFNDWNGPANLYEGGVKVSHHSRRRVAKKSL